MEVTRAELDLSLSRLVGEIRDPLGGIHGPESIAWRIAREAANFIGSGRAALLQLAHPPVACAIAEHSRTFVDLRGRFERTFAIVFTMTFGDVDQAVASARRLHAIHSRIRGELVAGGGRFRAGDRYAANERASLRWVYATLVDTVFEVRHWLGRPLSPAVAERYYRETHRFARLFGLEPGDLPVSYQAFRRWMREAGASGPGGEVFVSQAAAEMGRALLTAPRPFLEPLATRFQHITAALLSPELRRAFGLSEREADHKRARQLAGATYRALVASPEQLRFVPGYLDAVARVGLRSRWRRRLDRAAQRALPLWPKALLT